MIPSCYVQLDKLPLTTSGKLDRKALPHPQIQFKEEYTAATNEIEEKLIQIWSGILKIDKNLISIHANFFELGGHSINILTLSRVVSEEFKCHISVAKMFGLPTIKSIEAFIAQGEQDVKKMAVNIDKTLDEAHANLDLINNLIN